MKRGIIVFIAIMFATVGTSFNAYSQYEDEDVVQPKRFYYVGGVMAPSVKGVDFNSFDLSDYIRYPNAEGRAVIDLASNIPSGPTFGLNAGYYMGVHEKLAGIFELNLTGGNGFGIDLLLGGNVNFIAKESFTLGVLPKIGYAYRSISLGDAEVLGTPPVIAGGGSFYSGDRLSTTVGGFEYQAGLSSTLQLTNKYGLLLQVGYGGAMLNNMKITVSQGEGENVETFTIDMDSPDCVVHNKYDHIDFTPSIKMGGLYFSASLIF